MKHYSITRNNNGYVVGTGEQDVLRVSSKRTAVKIVADASGLMQACDDALEDEAREAERAHDETVVEEAVASKLQDCPG